MKRIYLDHAATTPLQPQAYEAMLPWFSSEFGNPSSLYQEGARAKEAIDRSREVLCGALGCRFGEVLFTSSGTEAANLAVVGAALAHKGDRKRVVFSAAEHHCVLNARSILERLGFTVDIAPVDRFARVDMDALSSLLSEDVLLVSVMHANNELGTVNDVFEVAKVAKSAGALFHCDAVQTFPWLNESRWTVDDIGADLVTLSAHKIGGPKGVGALYVRGGTELDPVTVGGGQERDMRAGTENVAAIVGFGEAVRQRLDDRSCSTKRSSARTAFLEALRGDFVLSVEGAETLTSHLHLRFPGASTESMLILLDRMGVAASSGAACSSGSVLQSHVLLACGWSEREANEGLRFTFGGTTTVEEAREAAGRVVEAANSIRTAQTQS